LAARPVCLDGSRSGRASFPHTPRIGRSVAGGSTPEAISPCPEREPQPHCCAVWATCRSLSSHSGMGSPIPPYALPFPGGFAPPRGCESAVPQDGQHDPVLCTGSFRALTPVRARTFDPQLSDAFGSYRVTTHTACTARTLSRPDAVFRTHAGT